MFFDGLLIGIGFVASAQTGVLITIALAIEVTFLGLSTAGAMSKARWSRTALIGTICGLALLLPTGGMVGASLLGGLKGGGLEVALSYGAAALLLYLVTEELLVEAHEIPETPLSTAMFFLGFLILLIIDMLSQT
ncbi:MAG TPA: hypothetical protein VFV83_02580 [Chthoniobacteraceae bacterium]|nr:hypothetical protein [Chthoniobacteraceae bacterium]